MNPNAVILNEAKRNEESPSLTDRFAIISKRRFFALLRMTTVLLFFAIVHLNAQEQYTQTIHGKVIDADSHFGLPNADIILLGSDPQKGTTSDDEGNFKMTGVPVGRQRLQVSYTGYQTVVLSDLYVSSGKETVLNIKLKELVETMKEVEITADYRKDKPIDPMALVSARSFTLEETNRYAGSYGDPGRMAANYAGVASSRDNRNDIIIRGNSPIGLQYRLNGIEITNPNHFAAEGTTGGPITILNTNLLANSDFLTGAYPAEYGNALAGIFDLRLRTGNSEKHEFWGQLGWNGLEAGFEGPLSKKTGATYLAAYRYSITDILEKLGVQLNETARYQDLSFNLNFPTKNAGVFSLIGMGGTSGIQKLESEKKQQDWTFATHGEDLKSGSSLGMIGLAHYYFFNASTSIESRLSVVGSEVESRIDTFSISRPEKFTTNGEKSSELDYAFSTKFSKKFNASNVFDVGAEWKLYAVNYQDSTYVHHHYKHQTGSSSQFSLLSAFTQWQHQFSNSLSAYLGLHYQYFTLNGSQSAEPRIGLKWNLNNRQAFSFGLGLVSQTQPLVMYFVESPLENASVALTNKQMGFSKSAQVVLGYDQSLNEFFRLKVETYYEHLYDIPVKQSTPEYSIINEGTQYFVERMDSLVNKGTGMNYGLELTLEKFMHRNYFFLFTASLFESQYKGYDGISRNTSYNSNYIINAVGGYELPFGKRKNRALVLGLRVNWTGGRPYLPFDPQATVAEGTVIYNWNDAYTPRHDNTFRGSFRIGMRRNERKFNVSFLFDIQYRANYTYIYLYRIDVVTGDIVKDYKMGWYPNSTVRFEF